jgi:aminoglycoside 6'-N-acetyltransferase I
MIIHIIDLKPEDETLVEAAARLLVEAFRETAPEAWPDLHSALDEVSESLQPGVISRVALDEKGELAGWIAGLPKYNGNVWELHPLAVRPELQGRGIGRVLVEDFEGQVRERGGITVTLGSDDEIGQTSLYGVDLYPDVWEHVRNIRNLKGHPYQFYQKLGYTITGVVPDANGPGKPDILLSKRVSRSTPVDSFGTLD